MSRKEAGRVPHQSVRLGSSSRRVGVHAPSDPRRVLASSAGRRIGRPSTSIPGGTFDLPVIEYTRETSQGRGRGARQHGQLRGRHGPRDRAAVQARVPGELQGVRRGLLSAATLSRPHARLRTGQLRPATSSTSRLSVIGGARAGSRTSSPGWRRSIDEIRAATSDRSPSLLWGAASVGSLERRASASSSGRLPRIARSTRSTRVRAGGAPATAGVAPKDQAEDDAGSCGTGRAIRRYLSALMDPSITLLEVHKLMYFLQDGG